jgi:hypothetical protein
MSGDIRLSELTQLKLGVSPGKQRYLIGKVSE